MSFRASEATRTAPHPGGGRVVDLQVTTTLPADRVAREGQWYVLDICVENPDTATSAIHLEGVVARSPEGNLPSGCAVDVDDALFEHGASLQPGERYLFRLPVRPKSAGVFDLSQIRLQIAEDRLNQVPVRTGQVTVWPSLSTMLPLAVTTICNYRDGNSKVMVTLRCKGLGPVDDLRVKVLPQSLQRAGMQELKRRVFGPDDVLEFQAVVAGSVFAAEVSVAWDGQRAAEVVERPLPPPDAQPSAEQRFRFLNPRSLVRDRIELWTADRSPQKVPRRDSDGSFVVRAGVVYELRVFPSLDGASAVEVLPGTDGVLVRLQSRPHLDGCWAFEVEAVRDHIVSKRMRLPYKVQSGGTDTTFSEVQLWVRPRRWRHLQFAVTLAGFATLGGIFLVSKLLLEHREVVLTGSVDPVGALGRHPEVLAVLGVPVTLIGLWAIERFRGWMQWHPD